MMMMMMISLHHKINEDLISVPFSDLLFFFSFQLFTKDWFAKKKKKFVKNDTKRRTKEKKNIDTYEKGHSNAHFFP